MVFVLSLIASILVLWGYGSWLDHVSESTKLPWVILFGWLMFPVLVLAALWLCATLIRFWGWLWSFRQVAEHGPDRAGDPVLAYLFPRSVMQRFQDKYPSLSPKECELAVDGLKHFFSTQMADDAESLSMPSAVVDALWQEFILHTREYEFFCRSVGFHMDRISRHTSAVDAEANFQFEKNPLVIVEEGQKALLSRDRIIRGYIFPQHAIENLKLKYPLLSANDCDLVVAALKEFLLINLMSDRGHVSMPSMAVDVLWREFILHTKSYRLFCEAVFGRFMHYVPIGKHDEFGHDFAGLELCWLYACKEEGIDSVAPTRLPLLFALDARLKIPDGSCYELNCSEPVKQYRDGKVIYCIRAWVDKHSARASI